MCLRIVARHHREYATETAVLSGITSGFPNWGEGSFGDNCLTGSGPDAVVDALGQCH
jgi:hypothetical protein